MYISRIAKDGRNSQQGSIYMSALSMLVKAVKNLRYPKYAE